MGQAQRRLHLGILGILAITVVLSRKPDAIFNAQFWAEDGAVWYRQAYDLGWKSLLLPQNGYFQTVSKLTAVLAQWLPLSRAPLFFNLVAALFKVLPVLLLCSQRGRCLLPSLSGRLLLSGFYLAHPYSWEVFLNVTNIHWHLALAALVLLYFDSWEGGWRKALDACLVALCGLSGIFAVFLAPLAIWRWYQLRNSRLLVLALILFIGLLTQVVAIALTGSATRSSAPLGESWEGLFRIFGGQVIAAGILGDNWARVFATASWRESIVLPLLASCTGLLVFARAWHAGNPTLRGLMLVAAAILAAALASPQISGSQPQWPLFETPLVGGRYVFIPIIALYASLLAIAAMDTQAWYRWMATTMLVLVALVAIPVSWRVPSYQDLGFQARAAEFEAAPPHATVDIPINPPGWSLHVRKKAP